MDARKVTVYWTLSGCFTLSVISFSIFSVHYFSKDWISTTVRDSNGTLFELQKGFADNCAKTENDKRYHCIPADGTPEILESTGIHFDKYSNNSLIIAHYFAKAIISLTFLSIICMIFLCRETNSRELTITQRLYSYCTLGLLMLYPLLYFLLLIATTSPIGYLDDERQIIYGKFGFAAKINLLPCIFTPIISYLMRFHIIGVCREIYTKMVLKNGEQNNMYALTEVQAPQV
uniref:G_PROTEIN_RECEP_F1_2 domain-containing protein n=1 Tax=Parastrongyloides trichosuri TaxID=131310 RepID=A0A0N4ZBW2_PARTI